MSKAKQQGIPLQPSRGTVRERLLRLAETIKVGHGIPLADASTTLNHDHKNISGLAKRLGVTRVRWCPERQRDVLFLVNPREPEDQA